MQNTKAKLFTEINKLRNCILNKFKKKKKGDKFMLNSKHFIGKKKVVFSNPKVQKLLFKKKLRTHKHDGLV